MYIEQYNIYPNYKNLLMSSYGFIGSQSEEKFLKNIALTARSKHIKTVAVWKVKLKCPECKGEGAIEVTKWEELVGEYDIEVICQDCNGTGYEL